MDTYSVVYSPAARDDLFGVYTYIATELLEPEIAAKQTVGIRNAIRKLEQAPRPPCQCQLGALVFHGYA